MENALLAFGSLLLGLVTGVRPVTVMVTPPVRAVAMELDGAVVATLTEPPFTTTIDFGADLVPRRLDAVGFDSAGREVARVTQWVNMPRQEAEVDILLHRDDAGRITEARLAWASVRGEAPSGVRVLLDGRPLPVSLPDRVEVPRVDPESAHVLRAEVTLSDGLVASREVVFGGPWMDTTGTELTAVPLECPLFGRPSSPDDLAGAITVNGAAATVAAVERPPARVVAVRDVRERRWLTSIPAGKMRSWAFAGLPSGDDAIGLMSTRPEILPTATGVSHVYTLRLMAGVDADYAIAGILASPEAGTDPDEQLLSDAVASAGLAAAAGGLRRAVVLVTSATSRPAHELGAAAARHLLEALHVPLRVWSTNSGALPALRQIWGTATDVSRSDRLATAGRELRRAVNRQTVAWIEGEHLPQHIGLDTSRTRCRLAH